MQEVVIFWFRRDLRWVDNHGLFKALSSGFPVVPMFIFDTSILSKLEDNDDARVNFLHDTLTQMNADLEGQGQVDVRYGRPVDIYKNLFEEYHVKAVYTNHDYEPYAKERDTAIQELCESKGIAFHAFKDQVIFEKSEVVKPAGDPYTVFTPYSKRWKAQFTPESLVPFPSEEHLAHIYQGETANFPSLEQIGFSTASIQAPPRTIPMKVITSYDQTRDFPAQAGTTRLGVHLRFGTLSIRKLTAIAQQKNGTYLNELIWREFYMMILWHFPHVLGNAFRAKYDRVPWRNNEAEFEKWCQGKTGYPLVDAGMRELNNTGYMHNRVRMVVASFLSKHLLIDWRWGEAYFARKLLDFDLSANNGGWQWAAGSGCDAAPYFRVFNPESQLKKFDKDLKYVRSWVPEFQELSYAKPMVEHAFARQRALDTYKEALQ